MALYYRSLCAIDIAIKLADRQRVSIYTFRLWVAYFAVHFRKILPDAAGGSAVVYVTHIYFLFRRLAHMSL